MEHLIVIILFLGAFCFPHCEALARPQNGDSHSSRYDNSAIRRTNREAGVKGNCRKEKKKKQKKNTRSRIVENFLHWKRFTCKWKRGRVCRKPIIYTREIPRSRCTVSKSTESRNTVVEAWSGKRHISYKQERQRQLKNERDNHYLKRKRVNEKSSRKETLGER